MKHILLVEDYPPGALVASTYLNNFGYQCDIAATRSEVLEKIRQQHYDAVLMDVRLGEDCGLELTREIRATEQAKHAADRLRIIAMTANAQQGDRQKCLDAGMDDYIAKPFQPQELREKLA